MGRNPSRGYIYHRVIIFIIAVACIRADVRVEFPGTFVGPYSGNAPQPQIYNTTGLSIDLAGWRFFTPNFDWTGIDGDPGATITITAVAGQRHHETRLAAQSARTIPYTGANPITQNLRYSWASVPAGSDGTPSGTYILWKTGASGIPVDPVDEDPITVDQIDSLIALPTYYDASYRYLDSLGTYGGTYSGGLLDTYYGQTQIMLAIPPATFSVNQTPINLDPSETGGPLFWMALAVGQEYFNIDMQLLIATGFKESGIAAAGLPYISQNAGGVYGAFHVENWTLLARAIAWPHFYPDDQAELAASANATAFAATYKPVKTFCDEYMGADITPENSAFMVNSVIISGLNYWYLYYLLGFSEDICWKEVLEFCVDPYIGVAALVPLYNVGMNSGGEAPLHVNNYQTLLNDPNARTQFAVGNSNYRTDVITAVEALVGASLQSLTDPGVQLWDDFITLDDIETFFFGDGGSVSSQGNGGLLKQFSVDRQRLWSDVQAAFDKLSPHWGQTPAAISWRYDFLTLLRVVKGMFNVNRPRPTDYESANWIANRSLVGGCSSGADDEFPYADLGTGTLNGTDYTLQIHTTDNQNVGAVKWTTDYDWNWWQDGTYLNGGATDQNYTITVTNATQGEAVWISVTDSSGNTIVKKTFIAGPREPVLDSTIIEDTYGNGFGDRITIHIRQASGDSADQLSEYQNLQYAWPNQIPMIAAVPANVTVNSASLVIADNTLTGGAGLGRVTFDYPSKTGYSDNVLDRVGPAITWDGATYTIPEDAGSPDTLVIVFTELIEENLSDGTAYLNLKTGTAAPIATVSTEVVHVSGAQWLFIFPAGTLGDKDSVNVVYTSGLVDTLANPPLAINQFVPIRKIGSVEPQWVIGYIKDTQGDGMGNEITITIQLGTSDTAYQPDDCEEIRYSWPQKNNFTAIAVTDPSVAITGSNYRIADNTSSGEGEGNAELDFPGDIMLTGDIIDSVGPAIITAVLNEKSTAGDPDTLTVTFTEPVAENLVASHQYLNVNGVAVTSLTAVKIDTESRVWLFTFAANTVSEGDKVNLIYNSGLIDKAFYPADDAHNPPLPNNQEVDVILLKGTYKVVEGKYLDTDAEGTMDSIVLTLSKDVVRADLDTMTFSFTWLDNTGSPVAVTVDGSDFTVFSGRMIGWRVTGYTLKQYVTSVDTAQGWGQATVTQLNAKTGQMETAAFTVSDGMGPVIVSAEYISFNSPGVADSLIVSFSEVTGTITGTQPFKFWTATDPEYLVAVSPVRSDSNQVTFYVINFTDGITPVAGDSIWIFAGNAVKDAQNVAQMNEDNIKQPLGFYHAYGIISAAYFDTSARPDGLNDCIRVTMNSVPGSLSFASIASSVVLPIARSFTTPLSAADFTATADGFAIYVTQTGVTPNTAVDNTDKLILQRNSIISDSAVLLAGECLIADSLAPVITKAIFSPAVVNGGNVNTDVPDTLVVTFSERIELPDQSSPAWPRPFLYCHGSPYTEYTMDLALVSNSAGTAMLFLVTDKEDYPEPLTDSIWIVYNARIQDNLANIQLKDTKRVPLIVEKYTYIFTLLAFPNPFAEDEHMDEKARVWQNYTLPNTPGENDIALLLVPYGYVNDPDAVSAELAIYDVVGNTVKEPTEMEYNGASTGQAWYVVWDRTNTHHRKVGQGTYLCVAGVKEGSDKETGVYKVMIGVRK